MNKLFKGTMALIFFAFAIGIFEMCSKENVIAQAASYVLPIATPTTLGGVKPDGTTILVDATGKISSAGATSIPVATSTTLGIVKPDGTTITVDGNGKISSVASQQQGKIVFATNGSMNNLSEIWIANYDGSNLTKIPVPSILPSGFEFQDIRVSPDGQTIFIAGYDNIGNISQVYSMTSTGANAKKIISYDGYSGSNSILSKFHVY